MINNGKIMIVDWKAKLFLCFVVTYENGALQRSCKIKEKTTDAPSLVKIKLQLHVSFLCLLPSLKWWRLISLVGVNALPIELQAQTRLIRHVYIAFLIHFYIFYYASVEAFLGY